MTGKFCLYDGVQFMPDTLFVAREIAKSNLEKGKMEEEEEEDE